MTGEQMPVSPSIIKWARERAGFDRDQLGTIASATVIQGWEEGRVAPTYLELECLADLFEVPIAVFFFPSPPKLPLIGRRFKTIGSSAFERFSASNSVLNAKGALPSTETRGSSQVCRAP